MTSPLWPPNADLPPYPNPAAGAVRTRVLLLLIALVVLGAVAAVIGSHFLLKGETPATKPIAAQAL